MLNKNKSTTGWFTNTIGKIMTRAVAGLALTYLVLSATPATAELRAEGTTAPDFTLQTLDGKKVSLSDLRGKPVVLEFWATWCGICRRQFPDMTKAHEKYGDQVQFVLVNTAEGEDVVRRFAQKSGLAGTILLDPKDDVGELYGTKILPSIFFVDEKGTIRAANAGALRNVDDFMATMLKPVKTP